MLADRVGLDVYAVGEHHRPDFAVLGPAIVLAAIAARTERIRLSSAVTVLSSDDPVRVFQSSRRSTCSRAAARRSWPAAVPSSSPSRCSATTWTTTTSCSPRSSSCCSRSAASERVTWSGRHRAALNDIGVYPRPLQDPLPVWVAVGGSPQSVARAGMLGLPLALAIIGGAPGPLRAAGRSSTETRPSAAGHDPDRLPVGVHLHGFLADSTREAVDTFYGPYAHVMTQHRPRARLAADDTRALPGSEGARRLARGRRPAGGHREDHGRAAASSAQSGSCCISVSARCPTRACCGPSSCSGPRSLRRSARSSRAAVRAPVPQRASRLRRLAPVAQLDRASVYGTEGQRFESSRAH